MAETIQSLGDVPLGRGGTGAAVTFGKVDYGYLDEDKAKKDTYKDYVTGSQYMQLAKRAGAVWEPDQPKVKQAVDEWYAIVENLERARKNKDAAAEQRYRKEMLDKQLEIDGIVENSKIMEDDWKKKEAELTKDDQFYYDEEDRKKHQEYRTLGYDERMKKYNLNFQLDRADDLNIIKKEQQDMLAQLGNTKPKFEKVTVVKNGKTVTEDQAYYDEQDVREAARRAADKGVLPGSKWERGYKRMLLNITDDPSTSENEQERARDIISSLPAGGTSPEFKELIAQSYYNTFKDQMEKNGIIVKPYTTPAAKRGGAGGGGKTPTVTIIPGEQQLSLYDFNTGAMVSSRAPVWNFGLSDEKGANVPFVVDALYVKNYAERNPTAKAYFNKSADQYVIYGDPVGVRTDKKTGKEFIAVSVQPPVALADRVTRTQMAPEIIEIPLTNRAENIAAVERKWQKSDLQQQNPGKSFEQYRKEWIQQQQGKKKPSAAPKSAGGVLRVKAKDGKIYTIPYSDETEKKNKIKAAKERGATVIQ